MSKDDPQAYSPGDWFDQAERDLKHARLSLDADHHEWACYASEQSAEKAVKALLVHEGITLRYSHDIPDLLDQLSEKASVRIPPEIREKAEKLEDYGEKTRYPIKGRLGPPLKHYSGTAYPGELAKRVAFPGAEGFGAQATWGIKQAAEAFQCAEEILRFVRDQMRLPSK